MRVGVRVRVEVGVRSGSDEVRTVDLRVGVGEEVVPHLERRAVLDADLEQPDGVLSPRREVRGVQNGRRVVGRLTRTG